MNFLGIIIVVIFGLAISVLVFFLVALCFTHPIDIPEPGMENIRVDL